ncbi:hypothetical protein [Clostridium butyricum]|uniref:hypothetical protein n=1 Tax=Clostridium butyricum TaxID=1492 RepID=UPI0022DF422E|nr:hypothetical protein [Clostridium butyricum]
MDTIVLVLPYVYIPKNYFFNCPFSWTYFNKNESDGFSLMYNGKVHLQYITSYSCLILTTSVTKFLYCQNFKILNIDDLDKLCCDINEILKQIFNSLSHFIESNLTNIKEWTLNRFDLVANFTCANDNVKETYLQLFQEINYPYLKKKSFSRGMQARNKSISINIYDKNLEVNNKNNLSNENILDKETLRLEIQIKKRGIKHLISKGFIKDNKFKDLIENPYNLNSIYKYYLKKFTISQKFLSKKQLNRFLLKLLKDKKISKTQYKNMVLVFIERTKSVCKNTLRKYKKILNEYNYSHITTDQLIKNRINFNNFELFKNDQIKSFSKYKLLIYLIFMKKLLIKASIHPVKVKIINLIRPVKVIIFYDDS